MNFFKAVFLFFHKSVTMLLTRCEDIEAVQRSNWILISELPNVYDFDFKINSYIDFLAKFPNEF